MNIVFINPNPKSLSHGNFVIKHGQSTWHAPCALGRSGMTCLKKEGDGATPIGRFRVIEAYYRSDRMIRPRTRLPLTEITANDGWCDAANDRNYNKKVPLPYGASHEKLKRDDHLYNVFVVLDYNITERKRGAGSAIFFHLAHEDFRPTEGCVAVQPAVMRRFLEGATTETHFIIER